MESKLTQLAKSRPEDMRVMSKKSLEWLANRIAEIKNPGSIPPSIKREQDRYVNRPLLGKMYFFYYDPKTKDRLPYYDTFPLVIPIERYPDGFLGLNLHYIHTKNRITLLDKLSETLTNDNYDEKTRLRISYPHLQASSRIFEATPCIKRYLFSHIESRFLEISADEWDIAVMLPVEQFVGASTSKVFYDSRKKF